MPFLAAATPAPSLPASAPSGSTQRRSAPRRGVDAAALEPFDGVVPLEAFPRLWEEAFRRAPREELPTEVGLAVPYGAFGALDYLAGSSAHVAAAFRARARLRALLPSGDGDAVAVARSLGMSVRTLQRRLAEAGTSFGAAADLFRQSEAERLLSGGKAPLAEVALRLGFSDQSAFTRAFRRWKGTSPSAWSGRRKVSPAPPPAPAGRPRGRSPRPPPRGRPSRRR